MSSAALCCSDWAPKRQLVQCTATALAVKASKEKEAKTALSAEFALRKAEKSLAAAGATQIASASALRSIRAARRQHWFERFHWFITKEGLICVAGRNSGDNEALVKRYLRPGCLCAR